MSNSVLTSAGAALIAQCQLNDEVLNIDQMVFADIDDLDTSATPSTDTEMPSIDDIVHQCAATKAGLLNSNSIVYSAILDSLVGDFYINFMGLYCSEHDVLVAVCVMPRHRKYATSSFTLGNSLIKNFSLEITDVSNLTGITVSADTWQMDFTARLVQIDERERLSNYDIYGSKYFFDDGFSIVESDGTYTLQAGIGYIDGIRVKLDAAKDLTITDDTIQYVYIDACLNGDITGVEALWSVEVSDTEQSNYVDDASQQHFVELLGTIAADGTITDSRESDDSSIIGEQDIESQINEHNTDPDAHPDTFDPLGAADEAIEANMLTADKTLTFDNSMTAAEIQALIDAVPKNLGGYTLTMQFADGTFALVSTLSLIGFYGGILNVYGSADDFAYSTSKSVQLMYTGAGSTALLFARVSAQVYIYGITIGNNAEIASFMAIRTNQCANIHIRYCVLRGQSDDISDYHYGIINYQSQLTLQDSYINNLHFGLYSEYGGDNTILGCYCGTNTYDMWVSSSKITAENFGKSNYPNSSYTKPGGTINGHASDRVGQITTNQRTTMQDALLMRGSSITKADYPLLVSFAENSSFIKTAAELAADETLRTFFTEDADDDTILYLPDWRGVSTRGLDPSGTFDPDGASRSLMSYQADAYASHTHTINYGISGSSSTESVYGDTDNNTLTGTKPTNASGGTETRGKNVAVNYFIYYN